MAKNTMSYVRRHLEAPHQGPGAPASGGVHLHDRQPPVQVTKPIAPSAERWSPGGAGQMPDPVDAAAWSAVQRAADTYHWEPVARALDDRERKRIHAAVSRHAHDVRHWTLWNGTNPTGSPGWVYVRKVGAGHAASGAGPTENRGLRAPEPREERPLPRALQGWGLKEPPGPPLISACSHRPLPSSRSPDS